MNDPANGHDRIDDLDDDTSVSEPLDLDEGPDRVIVQQNTGIRNMEGSGEWPDPDAEPRGPAPGTVPERREEIEESRRQP